jgi:hypothetical protein
VSNAKVRATAQLAMVGMLSSGLRHVGPELLAREAVVYGRALEDALAEAVAIADEVEALSTVNHALPEGWDPEQAWRALIGYPDGLLDAFDCYSDATIDWTEEYDRLEREVGLSTAATKRLADWLVQEPGADVGLPLEWVRHVVQLVLDGEVSHGALYALGQGAGGTSPLDATYWHSVARGDELTVGARGVLVAWLLLA